LRGVVDASDGLIDDFFVDRGACVADELAKRWLRFHVSVFDFPYIASAYHFHRLALRLPDDKTDCWASILNGNLRGGLLRGRPEVGEAQGTR
jgi:hypothetical protein